MKTISNVLKAITGFVFLIKSIGFVEAQQYGTLVDTRDGHVYKTVVVGTQTWMAQNLNYDAPADSIYQKKQIDSDPSPNPYHLYVPDTYCYNDSIINCERYGRLYIQPVALKACPVGWHVPSLPEFDTLLSYIKRTIGKDKKKRSETLLPGGSIGLDFILSGYGANLITSDLKKDTIEGQIKVFYVNHYKQMGRESTLWLTGEKKYKINNYPEWQEHSIYNSRLIDLFWHPVRNVLALQPLYSNKYNLSYVRCIKD